MEIMPYEPGMAPELARAYSAVVRAVPHCHPVSGGEFAAAAAPAIGDGQSHERLHGDAALVARDGSAIRGFVHLALERPEKGGRTEQGIVRLLWYERGHRAVGQALLEAAHEWFRDRRMDRATAFWQDYRYPFYHLGHAYLSDHLDHVAALLGLNGYERVAGEVFLDWPSYGPPEPPPTDVPHEIAVDREPGRGRLPTLTVKAVQGEEAVGVCHCVSCGDFSRARAAQDWFLIYWLAVDGTRRGRGLGKHLLVRALRECRAVGYRHAAISTAWDNWRAFVFYSNLGFRLADWTYGWRREL